MPFQLRGKYFEDLPVGTVLYTPARTVTEADVVTFAGFSGDYNPLHTDHEFAKQSIFGERIAHGLVSLAFVTGLMDKIGVLEGTTQAFLGLQWRFKKPVKFGDTLSVKLTVAEARATSRPGSGIVKFAVTVLNQREEEVSGGELDMMMAMRAAAPAEPSGVRG